MEKRKTTKRRESYRVQKDDRRFTLEVCIISGPISDAFVEKNPIISRTIQMRGDQPLSELHQAIFKAFDREDEHMYRFEVGGKGPMDPDAKQYVLPMELEDWSDRKKPAGMVDTTAIGSLGLKKDDFFGYWFDFGDDWWHQITVLEIEPQAGAGKYPKLTDRLGKSPPQYMDWDKEAKE